MFCGKTQNKEIDRVHKRALRIRLEDYTSSFDELLQKIDDTRVHVKNLRNLMVEIYKCLSCENPSFMRNIFLRKELAYNFSQFFILLFGSCTPIRFTANAATSKNDNV